jgi:hypothetical protein
VKFCVKHFAAQSRVRVTNRKTGAVVHLRTNAKGAGCVQVPIKRACHSVRQTLIANGTGDDGHPATVKQTVTTQPTASKCAKTHRKHAGHHGRRHRKHHKRHKGAAARLASANAASSHRFSGTDAAVLALIAGLAIIAAGATLTLVRRRQARS